jgi:competence protein ComEC
VIPLSGLILYVGIVASLFYFVPFIQFILVYILEFLIFILNKAVGFIEQLPYALLEGISISIAETCLLYGVILAGLAWYKTSKPGYIKWAFGFAILVCLLQVTEMLEQDAQKKLIVYNAPGNTAVDVVYGTRNLFIADSSFYNDPDKLLFNVRHNWDDLNLKRHEVVYTKQHLDASGDFAKISSNVLCFGNKTLQLVNETYNYKTSTLVATDYILLSKNPKINLGKLSLPTQKTTFIADGSNSYYKIQQWKRQAKSNNLKFYSTAESGAFVVELTD